MRNALVVVLALLASGTALPVDEPFAPDPPEQPGFDIAERRIELSATSPIAEVRVGPLRSVDRRGRRYVGPAILVKRVGAPISAEASMKCSGSGRRFSYRLANRDGALQKVRCRFSVRMDRLSLRGEPSIGMLLGEFRAFTAGDLDGDGMSDVALPALSEPPGIEIHRAVTCGNEEEFVCLFKALTVETATGSPPTILNLDGDGRPDLVVAGGDEYRVHLNLTTAQDDKPVFGEAKSLSPVDDLRALVLDDFNGDGRPDLAGLSDGHNAVDVYLSTTEPGAEAPTFGELATRVVGQGSKRLSTGDVSGDGKPDLVIAGNARELEVLVNTTPAGSMEATFSAPVIVELPGEPSGLALADFDGDGRLDVAVTVWSDGVAVLVNRTEKGSDAPVFETALEFEGEAEGEVLRVTDVNRDGRPDIVVSGSLRQFAVAVHLNRTAPGSGKPRFARARRTLEDPDFFRGEMAIADFTGDGWPDLAVGLEGLFLKDVLVIHQGRFRVSGFRLLLIEPVWEVTRVGPRDGAPAFRD